MTVVLNTFSKYLSLLTSTYFLLSNKHHLSKSLKTKTNFFFFTSLFVWRASPQIQILFKTLGPTRPHPSSCPSLSLSLSLSLSHFNSNSFSKQLGLNNKKKLKLLSKNSYSLSWISSQEMESSRWSLYKERKKKEK